MTRRLDLAAGVLLIERYPHTLLLDIPRGRLPVSSPQELDDLICALMQAREDWREGPAENEARAFVNQGTGRC